VALNGHAGSHQVCPLLKVDRPCHLAAVTSQFDHLGHRQGEQDAIDWLS